MSHDIREHIRIVGELLESELSFATITLLSVRGSAPQIVGAKAIVTADGLVGGTIGGGKIEAAAIKYAQTLFHSIPPSSCEIVTWNLQTDIGMTCGGQVQLLFETVTRDVWPIAVFGAGHVAQALVPLLLNLHCRVTCVDARADWLARLPSHPKLRKACLDSPRTLVSKLPPETFFVLMSKGHATDLPVLEEILTSREAPYVGVIGSQQKAKVLRRDLAKLGLTQPKIDAFRCPMGLPIGNNTPAEIAISVAAQLLETRDQTIEIPSGRST